MDIIVDTLIGLFSVMERKLRLTKKDGKSNLEENENIATKKLVKMEWMRSKKKKKKRKTNTQSREEKRFLCHCLAQKKKWSPKM